MKKYSFFDNYNSNTNIIGFVFLETTEDFYYDSSEILSDLANLYGDHYSVIVDLFLTNGFSLNRFLKIEYNKGSYKKSLIPITDIDSKYDVIFSDYIKNNMNIIEKSSLSKRVIDYLKEQLV